MDKLTIAQAADAIRGGKIVVFPTETVYGLAVDAGNPDAVEALRELKGREADKPLQVMAQDITHARAMVKCDAAALKLAGKFWPGPLTMILPALDMDIAKASGGGKTLGIRVPDHEGALRLIRAVGRPIIATSANMSGEDSTTTIHQVEEYFGDRLSVVLDDGPTRLKISSTVVDMTGTEPVILREGTITEEDIREALSLH